MNKILAHLKKLKASTPVLRGLPTEAKNKILLLIAKTLLKDEEKILKANARDLRKIPKDSTSAFRDRLTLNHDRLNQMAESLRQVARLPDPVSEMVSEKRLENGLKLKRVRAPLGVIFMIFESRPNVALEAFSLAFKSGNVIILRGGKESMQSTKVFYEIMDRCFKEAGLKENLFWGITDPDRSIPQFLLKQKRLYRCGCASRGRRVDQLCGEPRSDADH